MRGMKVCMDIQAALGQQAGVGRYVRELVKHLGPLAGEDELSAFFFDFQRRGLDFRPEGVALRGCRWLPGRVAQAAWKRLGWPPFDWLAGGADVYHFPNFICPPLSRGKRSVVTIHDVSFLRHPETTEAKNLAWLRAQIHRTAQRADAIITDSDFSAGEIVELLRVPAEKMHPIWLGLTPFPEPASAENPAARAGVAGKYLLTVGTIEPRKNLPFLVKVFEGLADEDLWLVIAGNWGWKTEDARRAIEESPRRERIVVLPGLDDASLGQVYAGAAAFVFPTLYEGFGFPPLEAMSQGVPVVAARNSSLPEVLGEAAMWVEGYEAGVWAAAVQRVVAGGEGVAALRAAGRERAGGFTWGEVAGRTWEVYRRVAAGG